MKLIRLSIFATLLICALANAEEKTMPTTSVCPAQWKKEGDKTLKPSAKIVGKIFEALK